MAKILDYEGAKHLIESINIKIGENVEGTVKTKEDIENKLGYKIWIGSETEKGTDPNTLYFCY